MGLEDQLASKGFFGTLDRLRRGVINREQAQHELEGGSPQHITSTRPDPYEYAAQLRRQSVPRKESWNRWVQITGLRPGMDAKQWYEIYNLI